MIAPAPLTFRGFLWRWTKRLTLTATLLALAAAPAAYLGIPALVRHPKAQAKMEKALTKAFGIPVQVDTMTFSWKEGLTLHEVGTAQDLPGTTFRIERVTIEPRTSRLLKGKLRFRATLENPEIAVAQAGPTEVRFPKFGKKGLRIDQIVIRNGSYVLKNGLDDGTVRFEGIHAEGTGRLQNRSVRVDLKSLAATCDEVKLSATGFLRLSNDGFGGELDLNEDAAKEPVIRDALRAARISLKKAPELSEPF